MSPRLRKVALTTHVVASVGWIGAVAAFTMLAVTGLSSEDAETVRAAYIAMDLTAWSIIVPLAFAALVTGVVQSLGTSWGLVRHYWVVFKLLLTVAATVVLLLQLDGIESMRAVAEETSLSANELRADRISLVVHAGGGIVVLLTTVVLAVFKPRGITRYGRRKSLRPT